MDFDLPIPLLSLLNYFQIEMGKQINQKTSLDFVPIPISGQLAWKNTMKSYQTFHVCFLSGTTLFGCSSAMSQILMTFNCSR